MKSNKSSDQFCQNVCYLRKTHHLTQKEMASVLGISVSTLRRIEREDETVRVSSGMLCRLCDHFGLSTDAVLRISIVGDGSPVPYGQCGDKWKKRKTRKPSSAFPLVPYSASTARTWRPL